MLSGIFLFLVLNNNFKISMCVSKILYFHLQLIPQQIGKISG